MKVSETPSRKISGQNQHAKVREAKSLGIVSSPSNAELTIQKTAFGIPFRCAHDRAAVQCAPESVDLTDDFSKLI